MSLRYLTYYTNSPTHSLNYTHVLTYSRTHLALRRPGHSPTLTSHGHRFDGELNRLAAETGCKGAEDGGSASVFGEILHARVVPFPSSNAPTRETSNRSILHPPASRHSSLV